MPLLWHAYFSVPATIIGVASHALFDCFQLFWWCCPLYSSCVQWYASLVHFNTSTEWLVEKKHCWYKMRTHSWYMKLPRGVSRLSELISPNLKFIYYQYYVPFPQILLEEMILVMGHKCVFKLCKSHLQKYSPF